MTRYILAIVMMAFSAIGYADSDGVSINPQEMGLPTDDDFTILDRKTEYQKKLGEFLRIRKQNLNINGPDTEADEEQPKTTPLSTPSNLSVQSRRVPRALRGKDLSGTEYDMYGNPIKKEKPKTSAYVALVSGMNGDYRAELHWGDQARTVMVGDSPFGGTWKIVAVNMDDIVISNGQGRRIKIGSYPVDVTTLFDE